MKSLDFYRSVHKDFTESTHCGSLISVVATVVLAALFVLEVRSFINVPIATEVIMDSAPDGSELQINFDFLMPDLVCQVTPPTHTNTPILAQQFFHNCRLPV
jgi:hypothetical protein